MSEETIDPVELGEYLEHAGLSDEEIDTVLVHFGVKGMRWGVRRDTRAQSLIRYAEGKGTRGDKFRRYATRGPLAIVSKKYGTREQRVALANKLLAKEGQRMLDRNKRVREGKASIKDILGYVGDTRIYDIIPTFDKTN